MNCEIDLKGYVLGEGARQERSAVEAHVRVCQSCREELDRLNLTRSALASLEDEEIPRRISFVSDRVFEPRWWQTMWRSGPVMGFASAALLSAAILVVGFARPLAPTTASSVDSAQIERRVEAQVNARVNAAVTKAVSEAQARQSAEFAKVMNAAKLQRDAEMGTIQQASEYLPKPDGAARSGQQRRVRQMRIAAVALMLLCALPAGSMADSPKVNRGMIEAMEHSLDKKLSGLWPQDPAEVLGLSHGAYIQGYGAIFLGEVNLAPAAGITPFHPSVTADEIRRTHEKKMQRMAAIRSAMRAMLVDSARSLDSVPADEQVALGLSLFYWKWENRDGLPAQIVMHAPRKVLLQSSGAEPASIATEEF